jgi:hypothetical protein
MSGNLRYILVALALSLGIIASAVWVGDAVLAQIQENQAS